MLRSIKYCLATIVAGFSFSMPTQALTMKECSAKYQEAQKAGTLKAMKWNDFRKAQCADDDAPESDAANAVPPEQITQPIPQPTQRGAPPAARPGAVAFPKTASPKYSNETPGKARLKTCADQYNANKAIGRNGDLKWIQQGGGYWSQCNARLKS